MITQRIQSTWYTKLLAFAGVSLLLLTPLFVFAQNNSQIVQCTGAQDCDFNAFIETFNAILVIAIRIAIGFFAIILAYSGWLYLTAGDSASKREKGHDNLKVGVIGFIVVLLAYIIVELIFDALGATSVSPFPGN